jgi:hypothetical protein
MDVSSQLALVSAVQEGELSRILEIPKISGANSC